VALLKKLINMGCNADEGHIILDFFAGSCTTAQAVLELNREDGGNRKFVLVQLPEPTGNAKFPKLTDIGEGRIRRVITKLRKDRQSGLDLSDRQGSEDLGFKVFQLSAPNVQRWSPDGDRDPEAYEKKLTLFNDPLVAGWQPANVIWEVSLREGFGL